MMPDRSRRLAALALLLLACAATARADDKATAKKEEQKDDKPLVKVIDLTTRAEESPLYLVFCARWNSATGHAFVVWGKEDKDKQMSTVTAWGYYATGATAGSGSSAASGGSSAAGAGSSSSGASGAGSSSSAAGSSSGGSALLGTVPGQIADDVATGSLVPDLVRLIVKVSKDDYDAADKVRQAWAGKKEYKLMEQDCVSFVIDVARAVGLRVPDRKGLDNLPWRYVSAMAGANDQSQYLNGVWQSTDDGKRFRLEITKDKCLWVERNTAGAEMKREVKLVEEKGAAYRISRPNDDEVLAFLGFQPALRAEIKARSPEPSYLLLSRKDDRLSGEWSGLLATKDNKGKLKELKQPGQTPAKPFEFVKTR